VIAEDHIDIVFRGEGEEVLPDLYRCLKEGRDFSHLPNITFKKNGRVISNEQSSKVDKLDTLPLFPYHHFDPKVYNLGFVLSSRGCPYKCTFCSNRATTGFVYRYRSAEIVLQEVELLYRKFNQKKIVIVDDIFSVNKKMIHAFLAGLRKKDFYGKVRFSINARGDNLDEDILQSLYDANFRFIYLGFETASENLMKEINKGETVADNVRAARIAKKIGFHVTTSFIFALPGETHQDRMEAVRLADELDLDLVKYNNTIPYPGTPLYETAKEENRLHVDGVYENFNSLSTFLESPFKKIRFAYVPKGSTEEEIRNDILYAHFAFYFSYRKIKNLFLNQSTGLSFSPGKTLKSIFKKIPAYGYVGYTLLLKLITLGFNVLLGKNTSIPRKKFWSLFVNSLTGKKKTTKMLEGTPMPAWQQQ
ncbi:MAG: B12-binding domain-containing radical SAM protein, partial [Myxococcota bacterium]